MNKVKAMFVVVEAKRKTYINGNSKRKEKRSYYCNTCKAWHVTSMTKNQFKKLEK